MSGEKAKTIFIIYNDLGIGGVQRKIVDLTERLSSKKEFINVKLYIILDHKRAYDLEEDIFLKRVRQSRAVIFYRPQENIWRIKFPLGIYVFWKTLVLKPTTILAFMEKYSIVAVAMKCLFWWRKIRVVISYDNIASLLIPVQQKSKLKQKIQKVLIRFFYPKADLIILPSNKAKEDMLKNFGISKKILTVNKNWILDSAKVQNNKYKYDLIYTGRVDPVKNLKSFVEIVGGIKKVYPKVKACIVGWGEDIDNISDSIRENSLQSSIELVGSQEDVSAYLSKSKIFLLTSYFEGLPISALEAMANGLPVISLDYPGARELINEGKNGYICKDATNASAVILSLLKNERERKKIGEIARKSVKSKHGGQLLKSFADSVTG